MYNFGWVASMALCYIILGVAPMVVGTWIMVQRVSGLAAGLWLGFLFSALVFALLLGGAGLLALGAAPVGPILGG